MTKLKRSAPVHNSTEHSGSKQNVEIQTLGQFLITSDSNIISEQNKEANKVWELFKFLLTNKGKRFFPEDILENLWPEREYSDPKAVFRYHIYRLRQILEQNQVPPNAICVNYSQGCYFLETECWLDADEFENLSRRANELSEHYFKEAVSLYYRALSLYKGEYLPGITNSWVLPVRNYYRHLYLKNVLELIDLLKRDKRVPEILDLCRKVLLNEPFEESLHLRYLESLLEENMIAEARSHYEYITGLMYQELGVKPSREMQDLYRSIKNSSEKIKLGFVDIQEMLEKREKENKVLFCEPEFFRFLFERERRRAEREGASLHIGLLTLAAPDYRLPPPENLEEAVEELKQVLSTNLRKSDVISQWNEAQFALLLPNLKLEQAEMVLQRIKKKFKQRNTGEKITLRSSAHSLFPWE